MGIWTFNVFFVFCFFLNNPGGDGVYFYLREAGLEALLLCQGGRSQARVGCTEEVASVHVESWNLSCRTWTYRWLNISNEKQTWKGSSNEVLKLNHRGWEEVGCTNVYRPINIFSRPKSQFSVLFLSPAADWETYTCGVCCCWGRRGGTQPNWEKLLLLLLLLEADRLPPCSCWGFTLQMLGGSEAVVVLVLSDDVVYVPEPARCR